MLLIRAAFPLLPRGLHALVAAALLLVLAPALAQVRMEDVRALPPLPAAYTDEPAADRRVAWLQERLTQPLEAVERYRIQRQLAGEHFGAHRMREAAALCRVNAPLRADIRYRARCLVAQNPEPDRHLPLLLALTIEARGLGNPAATAELLNDLAWRQSQAGDIAGAFESFEAALALVPADQPDLLAGVMMDTATSYIVNGDAVYIQKGIELLKSAREQMERSLADPNDRNDKEELRDNIQLTEFNRGIAYLLHLGDYEKALLHFERVAAQPNFLRADAMIFLALSAAELRQFARAKEALAQVAGETLGAGGPAVQQYLNCYRALAIRRWQPEQSLAACLALKPETTTEVQLDVYKRLSRIEDPAIALAGLKGLKTLFIEKLEPQLRRRGANAASSAELRRLQRESELKSLELQQQEALRREREATNAQRQNFFVALTLLLLLAMAMVALQWRAKKRLAEQYERLSVVDALTQVGNRRFLEQQIGRELSHLRRLRRKQPDAALGFYLFDVDHFKVINDRHGHAVGDAVLVMLARRIQSVTRDTDLLVRWGGEEFLLVARLDTPDRGVQIAERLLQAVNGNPFEIDADAPLPVSCTIGLVELPFLGDDNDAPWTSLVALADLGLYEGKARGRNRWVEVQNLGIADAEGLAQTLKRPLAESLAAGHVRLRSSD